MTVNLVALLLGGSLYLWARAVLPISLTVVAVARTAGDYGFSWSFYFPRPKDPIPDTPQTVVGS